VVSHRIPLLIKRASSRAGLELLGLIATCVHLREQLLSDRRATLPSGSSAINAISRRRAVSARYFRG